MLRNVISGNLEIVLGVSRKLEVVSWKLSFKGAIGVVNEVTLGITSKIQTT